MKTLDKVDSIFIASKLVVHVKFNHIKACMHAAQLLPENLRSLSRRSIDLELPTYRI